jgi:PKD repeat protein
MLTGLVIQILFIAGCGADPIPCFNCTSELYNGNIIETDEKVQFTNCSEESDSYWWDFGEEKFDGEYMTSLNNKEAVDPWYIYEKAGTYTVVLSASNSKSSKQISKVLEVRNTLSGSWEGEMILNSSTYEIKFFITQTGNILTGNFCFHDNSGFSDFSPTSKIIGQNITIDFTVSDYEMVFNFTGEVNNDFNEIDGTYIVTYNEATVSGTWNACKWCTKKSAKTISKANMLNYFESNLQE